MNEDTESKVEEFAGIDKIAQDVVDVGRQEEVHPAIADSTGQAKGASPTKSFFVQGDTGNNGLIPGRNELIEKYVRWITNAWTPDWTAIETEYVTTRVSCRKLAQSFVDAVVMAASGEVQQFFSEIEEPDKTSARLGLEEGIVYLLSKRIANRATKFRWTEKRDGYRKGLVASAMEMRTASDLEEIERMHKIEREDIERMRVTTMKMLGEVETGDQQFLFKCAESDTKAEGLESVSRIYERIQKMLYRSHGIAEKSETTTKTAETKLDEMPDKVLDDAMKEYLNA